MPDWKKELAYSISNVCLKCPINLSKDLLGLINFTGPV